MFQLTVAVVFIITLLSLQLQSEAFRFSGSIRNYERSSSRSTVRWATPSSTKTRSKIDAPQNLEAPGREVSAETKSKKFNPLTLLPIPALLFGGYELANAGNILMDPSQANAISSYWRYFLAGAISCSVSHLVTVPFDVVKTRIQLETEKVGIVDMGKRLLDEEGFSSFLTGAGPTVTGYFVQGAMKYGFFEVFKPMVRHYFEYQSIELDSIVVLMMAAGLAELIGSSLLTPFEAARIRLVSKPDFAGNIFECLGKQYREEGLVSLFLGLPAVMLKNVPYTVMQLSVFESLTKVAYDALDTMGYSAAEAYDLRFLVTFSTALTAAVLAGIASQPGDTLLSMVNKISSAEAASTTVATASVAVKDDKNTEFIPPSFAATSDASGVASESVDISNPITIMADAAQDLGVTGLFKGMTARLFHVSFIIVVQLLLYDVIKQLCGIPVTGMHH